MRQLLYSGMIVSGLAIFVRPVSAQETLPKQLNKSETQLYAVNPVIGIQALALGAIAAKTARDRFEPETLRDGNGDAFRHAYWTLLMKAQVGADWAKRWSDAHEESGDNTDLQKQMDLANNAVGLSADVSEHDLSQKTDWESIADKVQHWTASGKLRRIVGGRLVSTDGSGIRQK